MKHENTVPHDIMVTFLNGDKVTYTTRILHGPYGLLTDPMVVEIVDLFTGEVLYSAA